MYDINTFYCCVSSKGTKHQCHLCVKTFASNALLQVLTKNITTTRFITYKIIFKLPQVCQESMEWMSTFRTKMSGLMFVYTRVCSFAPLILGQRRLGDHFICINSFLFYIFLRIHISQLISFLSVSRFVKKYHHHHQYI